MIWRARASKSRPRESVVVEDGGGVIGLFVIAIKGVITEVTHRGGFNF
jgi:hypothetical protein